MTESLIWNNWHTGIGGRVNVQKAELKFFRGILTKYSLNLGSGHFLPACYHKHCIAPQYDFPSKQYFGLGHPFQPLGSILGPNKTALSPFNFHSSRNLTAKLE